MEVAMTRGEDDGTGQVAFACPHCGGPVHVLAGDVVECETKHRFTLVEVVLEQSRSAARAAWAAVRALEERAQASRWALRDPDLYGLGDRTSLEESAANDDDFAEELRQYARRLDTAVGSMTPDTEEQPDPDPAAGPSGTASVD
jgi:hypothetical protein